MLKKVTTLLFLFYLNASHAQNRYIDSINQLLKNEKTDTGRINLLNKKIHRMNETNLDSSYLLATSTLADARKIGYKKGEAVVLTSMATYFTLKGSYDSSKNTLAQAEKAVLVIGDSDLIAMVNAGKGMLYGVQSKYDSSAIFYKKAADTYERLGDKTGMGRSYGNLAIGYQMQSNFPQALYYQQKSLKLAEQTKNLTSQAYILMNMSNTYQNIGDTVKAEQSYLKGIEIAKSQGLTNVELYGYSNIAALYYVMKKWDASYTYAMRAATLGKTMGDESINAASLSKAALALMEMKKYVESETLAKQAIVIADSAGQPLTIYQSYSTLGTILTMQNKYSEALPYLEKSLSKKNNSVDGFDEPLAITYNNLSLCYEKTGNYQKALAAFRTSSQIIDSVRGKENIRKATELNMTYDFEKKQSIADAIQGKKNVEARTKQLMLLGGLLLAFVLAIGGWISFRNKKKANHQLQVQKEEIENTLVKLKDTQSQLIQAEKMASLGELTAGIAHEIQNPLNFVNNFSEVNTELIAEMKEEIEKGNMEEVKAIAEDIAANEQKINHHGKRADSIVKGMLQHSRSSSGQKEPTNINVLADEYLRLAYHGLRAKDKSFNATMNTDYDESIGNINIVPQDIGRAILNLITNAFYIVDEKKKKQPEGYEPTVSVSTKKINGKVEIKVKDNGNGIPQKVLDKIFQPFFTTKPTGQGTGLGLSLSYDIVKAHGGEIKVNTKENEGTEFAIVLPA